jgi:hypothetical protein
VLLHDRLGDCQAKPRSTALTVVGAVELLEAPK